MPSSCGRSEAAFIVGDILFIDVACIRVGTPLPIGDLR
eukprot:CAMPEP_0172716200 /NCGR_PEP_ID=MMETSP1074-20121228/67984_1 /TAXON_ID=2916 /ORGANISM="Ceratium fusus, Strain PA161109" /LENGTH=37 /DNA_ID= /DNA_START= /DNA_END= /DNA_ORIENTATION=